MDERTRQMTVSVNLNTTTARLRLIALALERVETEEQPDSHRLSTRAKTIASLAENGKLNPHVPVIL